MREVEEETGLTGCRITRMIAVYDWVHPDTHNTHERHIFHMLAEENTPETWTWIETSGGAVPESEDMCFCSGGFLSTNRSNWRGTRATTSMRSAKYRR